MWGILRRQLLGGLAACLWAGVAGAAEPPDDAAMAYFRSELAALKRRVPEVWLESVIPAIVVARRSDPRIVRLDGWTVRVSDDLGELVPRLDPDPRGEGGEIVLGHTNLVLLLYASQALTLHYAGDPSVANPKVLVDYIRDKVARAHALLAAERKKGKPEYGSIAIALQAVDAYLGLSPAEYNARMARLAADAKTKALGDYVGGLPVFFALLHEAGHVVADLDGNDTPPAEKETRADAFAAQVIAGNELPPSVGLAALLILSEVFALEGREAAAKAMACRGATLAREDLYFLKGDPIDSVLAPYAERFEATRAYWIAHFTAKCG